MKTRNSHGLLQFGREALAYCQCPSALISGNKALFVSVDLIGEKNQVILECHLKSLSWFPFDINLWTGCTSRYAVTSIARNACSTNKSKVWQTDKAIPMCHFPSRAPHKLQFHCQNRTVMIKYKYKDWIIHFCCLKCYYIPVGSCKFSKRALSEFVHNEISASTL